MYTMKIKIVYINEELLLFFGGRCHEEGKRGIIYSETTQKRLSIHVF